MENLGVLWLGGFSAALLAIIGLYCIIVSKNLIRILIGVEVLTKAVTLFLIVAGYVSGKGALAQALVVTLIVVEVVVIAVAAGIVVGAFQSTGDINAQDLQELKG